MTDRDAIHWRPDENWELYATAADIRAIPIVDAVVVTRCKDCEHYRNHPNGLCYLHTEPKETERGYSGEAVCVEPDDFAATANRRRGHMLTITIKANVPAADAQGIKERIAMDIERYGDCKVVSIVSDRGREEQLRMK